MRTFYLSCGFCPDKIIILLCGRNACYISPVKTGLRGITGLMAALRSQQVSCPTVHAAAGAQCISTPQFRVCSLLALLYDVVSLSIYSCRKSSTYSNQIKHAGTFFITGQQILVQMSTVTTLVRHQSGFPRGNHIGGTNSGISSLYIGHVDI